MMNEDKMKELESEVYEAIDYFLRDYDNYWHGGGGSLTKQPHIHDLANEIIGKVMSALEEDFEDRRYEERDKAVADHLYSEEIAKSLGK